MVPASNLYFVVSQQRGCFLLGCHIVEVDQNLASEGYLLVQVLLCIHFGGVELQRVTFLHRMLFDLVQYWRLEILESRSFLAIFHEFWDIQAYNLVSEKSPVAAGLETYSCSLLDWD